MLTVKSLSLFLFDKYIYKNISFQVIDNERIGLVGRNGSGKTTLFKVLSGQLEPDKGSINTDKTLKIGLLDQDVKEPSNNNLLEEAKTVFRDIIRVQQNITNIEKKLNQAKSTADNYLILSQKLADFYNELDILGGSKYLAEIENVLQGLGFSREQFNKKVKDFSSGWQMRLELAKIILQKNDLLLLDEPTNHLDIDSIIWLENYLKNYAGSIIIISHDKLLLDKITKRTIEISNCKINDFSFNYSRFLKEKELIIEKQIKEKKIQDQYIDKTKILIAKFRYKKSKAAFAQKLIKDLEKIEKIEVEQYDLTKVNFNLRAKNKSGLKVFEVNNLAKSFDGKRIFEKLNFLMHRGEKIAIVGANGQGKSLFIKSLIDSTNYEGEVKIGHNVKVGYFPQEHTGILDLTKSVFDNVFDVASEENRKNIRKILGNFDFKGDDTKKNTKILSGGEKNRLAICCMLVQTYNTLILDEPTNHLDIQVKFLLKKALMSFDGSLLLVSHDRDFLTGLVDKVFEIDNGKIFEFNGDITQYLKQKEQNVSYLNQLIDSNQNQNIKKSKNLIDNHNKTKNKIDGKLNKKINQLENKISKIEQKLLQLENILFENPQDLKHLTNYEQLNKQLNSLLIEWENLIEQ